MLNRFFGFFFLLASGGAVAQDFYLLVGTYDSPKSEGIYVYRFSSRDGTATPLSHIKASNPSFLAISPGQQYVYAVLENAKEGKGGEVAAFGFNKTKGELTFINQQLTGGDHPCYVETDKTGKWVFAGNYSSGSLAVLPVENNGGLSPAASVIQHRGSGLNPQRQQSPHVHCTLISPDNQWLLVPDLGMDKLMIYRFDATTGQLTTGQQPFAASEPGAGPRHFTFHPNHKYGYLVEELSGTVVAYKYRKGRLKRLQRISTMPAGDSSFAGSADIHISADGRFLYASNRSISNTIAIYSIRKKGRLALAGHQSTLGNGPRNFSIDPTGKFLLVGNQNSDEIVIFERNEQTGLLKDTGKRIPLGKPVCLKWIPVN
ncbi:MAG: lactonase family protein [Sphingobacteriales bacterium]|nr:lactonase family protein [Sphingobacteriales bacterium]